MHLGKFTGMHNSGWLNHSRDDVKAKAEWLHEGSDERNCLKAPTIGGTQAMLLYLLVEGFAHRDFRQAE